MNTFSKILGGLITVVLICGAGLGAYFGFKFVVRTFSSTKFYVEPLTAVAWGVTLLAALIIANSVRRAGQQQGSAQLLKERSEAYQVFVSIWSMLLQTGLTAEARNHPKTEADLKALDGLLALCASSRVIRAHILLREMERKFGGEAPGVRSQFIRALLEVRRDLGLESRGLDMKEMAGLVFAVSASAPTPSSTVSPLDPHPRVSLAPN